MTGARLQEGFSTATLGHIMGTDIPPSYCGDLEVEDDSFFLTATRLIVREGAISFHFSGKDKYGNFFIDGIAHRNEGGGYASDEIALVYPGYEAKDTSRISFLKVHTSDARKTCEVEGVWVQYGDTWKFWGELERYVP